MNKNVPLLAPLDIVLAAAFVLAGVLSLPRLASQKSDTVVVYRDNAVVAQYDLKHDRVFTIDGYEGPVVVEIKEGSAGIRSSTCRRQICVHTPAIRRPFSQIVCAPNHVIVEIRSGGAQDGLDAVSR